LTHTSTYALSCPRNLDSLNRFLRKPHTSHVAVRKPAAEKLRKCGEARFLVKCLLTRMLVNLVNLSYTGSSKVIELDSPCNIFYENRAVQLAFVERRSKIRKSPPPKKSEHILLHVLYSLKGAECN